MKDNILHEMWKIAVKLIEGISSIWTWLNTRLALGFDIPLIGYVGIRPFVPINVIGAGLVAIMVFWLIKALVPFL